MLPPSFLARPIAHRAYHDAARGRPENSRAAILAAVEAGYGIEIDIQRSSDGRAMVFHDYDLGRLTPEKGAIAQRTAEQLQQVPLLNANEGIPTLAEVLALVAGRVPLLIEIKDQDGGLGPNVGALERAVAQDLAGYVGDVALMSFNPHSVAQFAALAPDRPRGLTTSRFSLKNWPLLPGKRRKTLRDIPDYDRVGACFISHAWGELDQPRVRDLKAAGAAVLCWTVRCAESEAQARRTADNITFEGYPAA